MKKLSIVVPCYNEAKNIPLILERFNKFAVSNQTEVVLVNNGSIDDSQKVLDKLLPQYPFAQTTLVEKNQGYGFGILSGLRVAQGEYIGWTHADMQADPQDAVKALKIIEENGRPKDIYVKGNRHGRPAFDNFFTVGMSFFESFLLGAWLWDINAQPNIFHRSFFESWQNPPYDFSLDLYAYYTARQRKFNIIRFPVLFTPRLHGASSWNTSFKAKGKFIKRTMDYSLSLKRNLN